MDILIKILSAIFSALLILFLVKKFNKKTNSPATSGKKQVHQNTTRINNSREPQETLLQQPSPEILKSIENSKYKENEKVLKVNSDDFSSLLLEDLVAAISSTNYYYVIYITRQVLTSGLFETSNGRVTYTNGTKNIFKQFCERFRSEIKGYGLFIIEGSSKVVNHIPQPYYNPELHNQELMYLSLYQLFGKLPNRIEDVEKLEASLKKEKIKTTIAYASLINDTDKIIELAKNAKATQLNKRIQYTGTPLGFCAANDNLECFKVLIEAGADIKKKSLANYPIELAFGHSPEIVDYIQKKFPEYFKVMSESKGFLMAIRCNDENSLQCLLDNGADLIGKDLAFPNLHIFCDVENVTGIKFLLDSGYDINHINKGNETALERSIRLNNLKSVEYLKSRGAK